jgi:hypothetical protein
VYIAVFERALAAYVAARATSVASNDRS